MSAVTNQSIDMRIDTVTYHRLPGTTTTTQLHIQKARAE